MRKLVVLSGAGISAESGLKTFRDSDGLWEGYDVNEVATPRGWRENPERVLRFYNERRKQVASAKPNTAHFGLAALEKEFLVTIITQNIDDLHERAGSTRVLHLHGEIFKMRSERNRDLVVPVRGDIRLGDLAEDGAQFRPDIVWFEEPVPRIEEAIPLVHEADLFVVVGTSLAVYPAAGLVHYARPETPTYVIDKKIPLMPGMGWVTRIEKPATEGVEELKRLLSR
ncbi:MAG: SIR2 family NAD-dependent protein deacylase [Chitinophagaceae bacterium]